MRKNRFYYLTESTRFLTNRLGATISIAVFGMLLLRTSIVLLSLLLSYVAPYYENGFFHRPVVFWLLGSCYRLMLFILLSPLLAYAIPRFLAYTDAQAGDNSLNAPNEWLLRFKERWPRLLGSTILLYSLLFLCNSLIDTIFRFQKLSVTRSMTESILSMIAGMIFSLFSLHILLRGESMLQAAKSSLEVVRRTWLKTFIAVMVISIIPFTASYVIDTALRGFFVKGLLTTQQQLTHPFLWIGDFIKNICILWVDACFLSLYRETKKPYPIKS